MAGLGMGAASRFGMSGLGRCIVVSGIKEAEIELEKVEEVLAMADRAIKISRMEQERLSSDLPAAATEPAEFSGPAVEQIQL
jgi:hypothetical protein